MSETTAEAAFGSAKIHAQKSWNDREGGFVGRARYPVLRVLEGPAIGPAKDVCYGRQPVARSSTASFRAQALDHADALFRLAYQLTRSHTDAEDLVQDTYARAFSASSFEEGTNLRAWLFRILRNAHIDAYRRERRSPISGGYADEDDLAVPQELLRDDQELERLRRVVAEDIEAALHTLSPDARTIVLLELEGFTESELATVLGCPLGTVKSRLARARAALRLKLRDYARQP
jgi:RNA polymerase sigma-70 factor, ECF subfamily